MVLGSPRPVPSHCTAVLSAQAAQTAQTARLSVNDSTDPLPVESV